VIAVRTPANPAFKADKGVALRTGRDDRLEYTADRSGPPSPPKPLTDARVIDGWRWTRNAYDGLMGDPSLHYCDVKDALENPHTVRPGNTSDTRVHEHGQVKVVIAARTVVSITTR